MKTLYNLVLIREERKYWPTVEESVLSYVDRIKYQTRKRVVDMYIEGYTLSQIAKYTGIKGLSEPSRLLQRCLSCDEWGHCLGYTALLSYKHLRSTNQRKKELNHLTYDTHKHATGMFSMLLSNYPELKEYINNLYFGKVKTTLEKNISTKYIHSKFLKKCMELGIKEYEYPFNIKSKGIRSLYNYIADLKANSPTKISSRLSKDAFEKLTSTGLGQVQLMPEIRPFSIVQIDGHKIDCIATIEITTPQGDKERKTIQRFWLLTLIDVATRAILGYHLTIESAYDRFDVLKCIQNAIEPKKLLTFTIPGLEYPENTGFHSLAIPESQWAVFDEIMLDNALAHLSNDVINKITTYLNATVNFGPVASPERRGIVERFYQTIESRGFHRIISTTGTGITDPKRRNAERDAIKYAITFEQIEELTEIMIAQYNNFAHSAINGFTPLSVMEQRMAKGLIPNYLEEEKREKFMLNYITVTRKIRGKLGTGRRPYVSFEGAEYRSDTLSKSFQLVGKTLILRFNPDDIRVCMAFFEDGSEFCELCVVGQWKNQPHSLDQRKSVNKLLIEKKLKDNNFIDPIQTYDNYLSEEAQKHKCVRNKLAARELTKNTENKDLKNDNSDSIYREQSYKNVNDSMLSDSELQKRFSNVTNKIRYR
nr:hypothetical protein [uncultured Anaerosporobacter sp.]